MTPTARQRITELHAKGLGSVRIARALDLPRWTVQKVTRTLRLKHSQPRGENHYAATLTEARVREIRVSRDSEPALAARFGVSVSAVHEVRRGRTWKWVV